ncbi:MAG TPA: hypothetical protein VH325_09640 [Bryobacteraceae bacterium]|jgi:hypothetical protein|nr:hypothetical protein [Bryobacteraceae bacterium]
MALFTDADVITIGDLQQFESALVEVASTHDINVSTKITLATSSIGDLLMLWLLRSYTSDPQWLTRRVLGLSTVVVTPTLHRWLCFEALSRFYSEAYNVQLNTRFQGKWTEYQTASSQAADMVSMSGIGIVYHALPKPAMPSVSIGTGNALVETVFVQTAWIDSLGNEGALSTVNALALPGDSSISTAMAEGALGAPASATGWNVYVSTTEDATYRQNGSPLAIGSTWTLPASGFVDGPMPIDGQQPNYYVIDPKRIQRG